MIDVINKKGGRGVDAYVETADIMFGLLFQRDKLRKALRWVSKQDTLGMIYGMGVNKMVWQTTHLMTDKFDKSVTEELGVSEKWAYEVLQDMYKLYPVREFMNEKVAQLYKQGYVRLEFHSRLMDFIRDYRVPQDKAYKAVNIIIQGTAAYVIKCAMLRLDSRIEREGWRNKVDLIMQVHDELIFEVDKDMDLKHVDKVLSEEMEDWETFKVPITCSAKWSDTSWGDVIDL
jgi:DNA polymerase-1